MIIEGDLGVQNLRGGIEEGPYPAGHICQIEPGRLVQGTLVTERPQGRLRRVSGRRSGLLLGVGREAKVTDFDIVAGVEEDIRRLQIAVNIPKGVDVLQSSN